MIFFLKVSFIKKRQKKDCKDKIYIPVLVYLSWQEGATVEVVVYKNRKEQHWQAPVEMTAPPVEGMEETANQTIQIRNLNK